jgi:hypothetical protein
MNSHGKGTLKPQQEEGISEVKFADLDWFKTLPLYYETDTFILDFITHLVLLIFITAKDTNFRYFIPQKIVKHS